MIYALAAYIIGSIMTFVQHNLQFVNPVYKDKQILLIVVLSYPIAFAYYYAWTYFVTHSGGSAWSARFIFFGLSYLVYPILTWLCLNETPFSFKTLLCTFLSVIILFIQFKL